VNAGSLAVLISGPGQCEFIHPMCDGRGSGIHLLGLRSPDEVGDELPGRLDVGKGVLAMPGRAEVQHGGRIADRVEEAGRREVEPPRRMSRRDPADRSRRDDRLEGLCASPCPLAGS
jgi:hypothetical protein